MLICNILFTHPTQETIIGTEHKLSKNIDERKIDEEHRDTLIILK